MPLSGLLPSSLTCLLLAAFLVEASSMSAGLPGAAFNAEEVGMSMFFDREPAAEHQVHIVAGISTAAQSGERAFNLVFMSKPATASGIGECASGGCWRENITINSTVDFGGAVSEIVSDEIAGPQTGSTSGPWFVKVRSHDGFDALAMVKTTVLRPDMASAPLATIELVGVLHPNSTLYYSSADSWLSTVDQGGQARQQDRWGPGSEEAEPAVRATHVVPIGNICEHNKEIKQAFAVLRVERSESLGNGVVNRSGTLEVFLGAFRTDASTAGVDVSSRNWRARPAEFSNPGWTTSFYQLSSDSALRTGLPLRAHAVCQQAGWPGFGAFSGGFVVQLGQQILYHSWATRDPAIPNGDQQNDRVVFGSQFPGGLEPSMPPVVISGGNDATTTRMPGSFVTGVVAFGAWAGPRTDPSNLVVVARLLRDGGGPHTVLNATDSFTGSHSPHLSFRPGMWPPALFRFRGPESRADPSQRTIILPVFDERTNRPVFGFAPMDHDAVRDAASFGVMPVAVTVPGSTEPAQLAAGHLDGPFNLFVAFRGQNTLFFNCRLEGSGSISLCAAQRDCDFNATIVPGAPTAPAGQRARVPVVVAQNTGLTGNVALVGLGTVRLDQGKLAAYLNHSRLHLLAGPASSWEGNPSAPNQCAAPAVVGGPLNDGAAFVGSVFAVGLYGLDRRTASGNEAIALNVEVFAAESSSGGAQGMRLAKVRGFGSAGQLLPAPTRFRERSLASIVHSGLLRRSSVNGWGYDSPAAVFTQPQTDGRLPFIQLSYAAAWFDPRTGETQVNSDASGTIFDMVSGDHNNIFYTRCTGAGNGCNPPGGQFNGAWAESSIAIMATRPSANSFTPIDFRSVFASSAAVPAQPLKGAGKHDRLTLACRAGSVVAAMATRWHASSQWTAELLLSWSPEDATPAVRGVDVSALVQPAMTGSGSGSWFASTYSDEAVCTDRGHGFRNATIARLYAVNSSFAAVAVTEVDAGAEDRLPNASTARHARFLARIPCPASTCTFHPAPMLLNGHVVVHRSFSATAARPAGSDVIALDVADRSWLSAPLAAGIAADSAWPPAVIRGHALVTVAPPSITGRPRLVAIRPPSLQPPVDISAAAQAPVSSYLLGGRNLGNHVAGFACPSANGTLFMCIVNASVENGSDPDSLRASSMEVLRVRAAPASTRLPLAPIALALPGGVLAAELASYATEGPLYRTGAEVLLVRRDGSHGVEESGLRLTAGLYGSTGSFVNSLYPLSVSPRVVFAADLVLEADPSADPEGGYAVLCARGSDVPGCELVLDVPDGQPILAIPTGAAASGSVAKRRLPPSFQISALPGDPRSDAAFPVDAAAGGFSRLPSRLPLVYHDTASVPHSAGVFRVPTADHGAAEAYRLALYDPRGEDASARQSSVSVVPLQAVTTLSFFRGCLTNQSDCVLGQTLPGSPAAQWFQFNDAEGSTTAIRLRDLPHSGQFAPAGARLLPLCSAIGRESDSIGSRALVVETPGGELQLFAVRSTIRKSDTSARGSQPLQLHSLRDAVDSAGQPLARLQQARESIACGGTGTDSGLGFDPRVLAFAWANHSRSAIAVQLVLDRDGDANPPAALPVLAVPCANGYSACTIERHPDTGEALAAGFGEGSVYFLVRQHSNGSSSFPDRTAILRIAVPKDQYSAARNGQTVRMEAAFLDTPLQPEPRAWPLLRAGDRLVFAHRPSPDTSSRPGLAVVSTCGPRSVAPIRIVQAAPGSSSTAGRLAMPQSGRLEHVIAVRGRPGAVTATVVDPERPQRHLIALATTLEDNAQLDEPMAELEVLDTGIRSPGVTHPVDVIGFAPDGKSLILAERDGSKQGHQYAGAVWVLGINETRAGRAALALRYLPMPIQGAPYLSDWSGQFAMLDTSRHLVAVTLPSADRSRSFDTCFGKQFAGQELFIGRITNLMKHVVGVGLRFRQGWQHDDHPRLSKDSGVVSSGYVKSRDADGAVLETGALLVSARTGNVSALAFRRYVPPPPAGKNVLIADRSLAVAGAHGVLVSGCWGSGELSDSQCNRDGVRPESDSKRAWGLVREEPSGSSNATVVPWDFLTQLGINLSPVDEDFGLRVTGNGMGCLWGIIAQRSKNKQNDDNKYWDSAPRWFRLDFAAATPTVSYKAVPGYAVGARADEDPAAWAWYGNRHDFLPSETVVLFQADPDAESSLISMQAFTTTDWDAAALAWNISLESVLGAPDPFGLTGTPSHGSKVRDGFLAAGNAVIEFEVDIGGEKRRGLAACLVASSARCVRSPFTVWQDTGAEPAGSFGQWLVTVSRDRSDEAAGQHVVVWNPSSGVWSRVPPARGTRPIAWDEKLRNFRTLMGGTIAFECAFDDQSSFAPDAFGSLELPLCFVDMAAGTPTAAGQPHGLQLVRSGTLSEYRTALPIGMLADRSAVATTKFLAAADGSWSLDRSGWPVSAPLFASDRGAGFVVGSRPSEDRIFRLSPPAGGWTIAPSPPQAFPSPSTSPTPSPSPWPLCATASVKCASAGRWSLPGSTPCVGGQCTTSTCCAKSCDAQQGWVTPQGTSRCFKLLASGSMTLDAGLQACLAYGDRENIGLPCPLAQPYLGEVLQSAGTSSNVGLGFVYDSTSGRFKSKRCIGSANPPQFASAEPVEVVLRYVGQDGGNGDEDATGLIVNPWADEYSAGDFFTADSNTQLTVMCEGRALQAASPAASPSSSRAPASSTTVEPSASPSSSVSSQPSPTPSPRAVDCVVSAPDQTPCSKDCGDGGVRYNVSRILALPLHGGVACPEAASLVVGEPCPLAGSLPECPADDPCADVLPPCGASSSCGLCGKGRACQTSQDCVGGTGPLVCRQHGSTAELRCLEPLASPVPGAANTPLSEALPPLTSIANATGQARPRARVASAVEEARGTVVQQRIDFGDGSALRNPAVLQAIETTYVELVLAAGVPVGSTVTAAAVVIEGRSGTSASLRRSVAAHWSRRGQQSSSSAAVVVSVAVTAPLSGTGADRAASVMAALGSNLVSALEADPANVRTAVSAAMVQADPAAGAASPVVAEPVYAVIAASDGAIIAGSPSLMALVGPSASPSAPLPSPSASGGSGGADSGLGGGAIAGIVGGIVAVAGIAGLAVWLGSRRRRAEMFRAVVKPVPAREATSRPSIVGAVNPIRVAAQTKL